MYHPNVIRNLEQKRLKLRKKFNGKIRLKNGIILENIKFFCHMRTIKWITKLYITYIYFLHLFIFF